MVYDKTVWQAREVQYPNRFTKVNENASSVDLYAAPGTVTVPGTAFSADHMNNIENGIEAAEVEINQVRGVLDFTAAGSGLQALSQASRSWSGITSNGTDVYACVDGGDIYKQTNGTGVFVALSQTSRNWTGMATLGGDVYACVQGGSIYKQTSGTGDFVSLNQTSRNWFGMGALGSDVYACVMSGDIYKQTGGIGDFIALSQTSRNWSGMASLGGDMYACVINGDIYKQTGGTGTFNPLGQTSRVWFGMASLDDDIYACDRGGDVYKQAGGVGSFVGLGQTSRDWHGMASLGTSLYVPVEMGDIYATTILTGNTLKASASFTLPAMPDGARKRILNTHATNAITVTAYSGTTIEGQATMTLSAGHEVEIELIGTDWRKVVLSQSATPAAGKAMVWPSAPSGVFTPVVSFGGNSVGVTYASRTGRYVISGGVLHFWIAVSLTSKGTSEGRLVVSGLPQKGSSSPHAIFSLLSNNMTFGGYPVAYMGSGLTGDIIFESENPDGTYATITNEHCTNNLLLFITGMYEI